MHDFLWKAHKNKQAKHRKNKEGVPIVILCFAIANIYKTIAIYFIKKQNLIYFYMSFITVLFAELAPLKIVQLSGFRLKD